MSQLIISADSITAISDDGKVKEIITNKGLEVKADEQ